MSFSPAWNERLVPVWGHGSVLEGCSRAHAGLHTAFLHASMQEFIGLFRLLFLDRNGMTASDQN